MNDYLFLFEISLHINLHLYSMPTNRLIRLNQHQNEGTILQDPPFVHRGLEDPPSENAENRTEIEDTI